MNHIEEIIKNLDLTYDEMCRNCIEYLETSDVHEDYRIFADLLVDVVTSGSMKYDLGYNYAQDLGIKNLKKILKSDVLKEKDIYLAFVAFHEKDRSAVFQLLLTVFERYAINNEKKIDCDAFIYGYVMMFKNAFPGFWLWLGEQFLFNKLAEDGIAEICTALELFYYSKNSDEILENLLLLLTQYTDIYLIEELLGYTYYDMKLWKNAIAYYERVFRVKDRYLMEDYYLIAFKLGWANLKIKNYVKSIEYYEEVLHIDPDGMYALNNLGFCYLQLKKLDDALKVFDKCINENRDAPYCYNNKVSTLIAMGKAPEALTFAQENLGRGRVGKDMVRQAETALKRGATRLAVNIKKIDEGEAEKEIVQLGVPKQQFSTEKILEDELVNRLERGVSTFGLKLRIFEQEGDYYGRQYPIIGGRIDILAVDNENNFYAIELKKDDGYGDVCQQVQNYISWLREHKALSNQKVFGIICLNNPSTETIQKIQISKDIRLFEYSISYREIS